MMSETAWVSGKGSTGGQRRSFLRGRCQAIFERRRRFDRQICAWPAVAFALRRRETRTFAAAMLLSCAVRPVSRLVLVSARVRERRAGQRRVGTVLLDAEEYKRGSPLRGGKQPERDLCPGGARAARTHDHDRGLHALHGDGDLSRYATTLLLQDLRDAARVSVAVLGVAFKGKAIGNRRFSKRQGAECSFSRIRWRSMVRTATNRAQGGFGCGKKSFVKKAELSTVSPAPRVPPGWEVRARAETHPTRARWCFRWGARKKAGCR